MCWMSSSAAAAVAARMAEMSMTPATLGLDQLMACIGSSREPWHTQTVRMDFSHCLGCICTCWMKMFDEIGRLAWMCLLHTPGLHRCYCCLSVHVGPDAEHSLAWDHIPVAHAEADQCMLPW